MPRTMITFPNRVLFLGFGAVAECTLPIFFRHVEASPARVTVLDFEERASHLREWAARGLTVVRDRVTEQNLGAVLGRYLSAGDLLVDLAWNIDAGQILQWCHDHGVLYVNTSTEVWDPYLPDGTPPTQRTLYWRQMRLRERFSRWTEPGPTAVLEHGANPGLISHFTKQALLDIAEAALADRALAGAAAEQVRAHAAARQFAPLARALEVKVIHCSERDTQVASVPKAVDEFVNTWSVEGFREEGTTTAEMGWGTHERWLPALAHRHTEGPRNQICLARMGINTWVRSWVPGGPIHGMVVRHGEAFSISERLTVREGAEAVYRPTVHYAYCPCDAAIASLTELRGGNYRLQSKQRIMTDEITTGSDVLGAFLMGHALTAWWTGSDLSIEESRQLLPHQNATTMQVAISVVGAVTWMIRNPSRGVVFPEDLPHEEILDISRPYLGRFISTRSDWTPLSSISRTFTGFDEADYDLSDPWQFKNFLIREGQ
ncbi:MAG TPA: saccharopine dehydrogenase C-terminal domain-containing protein [Spirochaetia bacterium]|nr:saccharopine dehydrogenase C-terminal domain-containing protein [Spirochaetia bacterium]